MVCFSASKVKLLLIYGSEWIVRLIKQDFGDADKPHHLERKPGLGKI